MEHRDRDSPRLVLSRVVVALLAAALGLTVAGVVGSQLLGSLKNWLHGQKLYETTFGAIELEPPPPPWYCGGRTGFLRGVQDAAQRPDVPYSALDIDLAELRREFRLYCWVKRVGQVQRKWPNRIIVPLDYRNPVARAHLPGKPGLVLLDDEGVILPATDVNPEAVDHAALIKGLDPPFEPRPGRVWSSTEGRPDPRVLAAVKLAAFLQSALARAREPISPVLQPKVIHPVPDAGDGLFVENAESSLIYWGDSPGSERPGSLTAEEKWEMLQRWLPHRPPAPVRFPFYLSFTKEEVIIARGSGSN
jgi:hypothetical protein